jgi:hypothetical protein
MSLLPPDASATEFATARLVSYVRHSKARHPSCSFNLQGFGKSPSVGELGGGKALNDSRSDLCVQGSPKFWLTL